MGQIITEMGKYADMQNSIKVEDYYDVNLEKITGVPSEPMFMSEWSTFVYLLKNILMAYPEIEKQYPPGKLKMTLNGEAPKLPTAPLFNDDKIEFSV